MFRLFLIITTFLIIYGQNITNVIALEKSKKIKAPDSGVYVGLYMSSAGRLADIESFKDKSEKRQQFITGTIGGQIH
ncbi:MAG: hypothetical protein QMD92_01160 [bacterium]|nr:hypothetical protein [bacterium]